MITKSESPRFRVITEDYAELFLSKGKTCLIDTEDIERITRWKWKARKSRHCWYAVRSIQPNGKKTTLSLHRWLMNTPPGLDCHHEDSNSLNNRKSNLINLSPGSHKNIHANERITKCQTT